MHPGSSLNEANYALLCARRREALAHYDRARKACDTAGSQASLRQRAHGYGARRPDRMHVHICSRHSLFIESAAPFTTNIGLKRHSTPCHRTPVLCRSLEVVDLAHPAGQWVPSGENLGHQPPHKALAVPSSGPESFELSSPMWEGVNQKVRQSSTREIVVNAAGLRRVLTDYVAYHMRSRTHLVLGKDTPILARSHRRQQVASSPFQKSAGCTTATTASPRSRRPA